MSETLKISVIVPVYKVESFLNRCVDSLIGQTYQNLEIILIDDGSPDRCPEICDLYAKQDSRVRVIHKENGGVSSARNVGLDAVTGDIIAFVDGDDWLDSDAYERMMAVKQTSAAQIVCCNVIRSDGEKLYDTISLNRAEGTVEENTQIVKEILLDRIGSQVYKAIYDKSCWENLRFPNRIMCEEMPVTHRAFERAEAVAFVNAPLYKYRINLNGLARTPNPIKAYHTYLGMKEHYEYASEHYPDIAEACCANAAHYAISTYFHACSDAKAALEPYKDEVYGFLTKHKGKVNIRLMKKSRGYALRIFYFSEKLFKLLCLVLHKTGLQTKLNLDAK